MRELIGRLADGRRTLLISSHALAELDQVCDWLVVIEHGSLVYQGATREFGAHAGASVVAVPQREEDLDRLRQLVEDVAAEHGIDLSDLCVSGPTLEERYLATTDRATS